MSLLVGNNRRRTSSGQGISTPTMASSSPTSLVTTLSKKTFKDYYDRLLRDADIGHFTFHALRHTFATRALERGMDYKTLSSILGHYSVAFTMDT